MEPATLKVPETNTVVKNKNIIFKDEILNIEDYDEKVLIKEISKISIYSLENCLKIILESNPNTIFYNIQYSKTKETIYFYTNEDINLDKYYNRKKNIALDSETKILEEIKRVLLNKKNNNIYNISLYDIMEQINIKKSEYELIGKEFTSAFNKIIKSKYGKDCYCNFYYFDYNYDELNININGIFNLSFSCNLTFGKNGENVYFKTDYLYEKKIKKFLINNEKFLLSIYDKFIQYSEFIKQFKNDIIPINSNFLVNINSSEVYIYSKSKEDSTNKLFKLSLCKCGNEYDYEHVPSNVIKFVKGNENLLFKNIYIEINDCPKWLHPILYEIRCKQLNVNTKNIEKNSDVSIENPKESVIKKVKILELKNKIFPFIKK